MDSVIHHSDERAGVVWDNGFRLRENGGRRKNLTQSRKEAELIAARDRKERKKKETPPPRGLRPIRQPPDEFTRVDRRDWLREEIQLNYSFFVSLFAFFAIFCGY
jgi:hypothetical protein